MPLTRHTRPANATRIGFALLLLAIIAASLFSGVSRPTIFADDKMDHILAFFVLGAAAKGFWPEYRPLAIFLVLAFIGGGIETLQWLMAAGREADWADFAVDLFGAGLGILIADGLNAIRTRIFGPAYI